MHEFLMILLMFAGVLLVLSIAAMFATFAWTLIKMSRDL